MSDPRKPKTPGITDATDNETVENAGQIFDPVFGGDEEVKTELVNWMEEELADLRPSEEEEQNERARQEQRWRDWRRLSLAQSETETKDRPWKGASNVTTPFMFSNINGVVTHIKAALTEKEPRHKFKSLNEDYVEHAGAIERWMNTLLMSPLHINLPEYDNVIPYETARLGTQVVETAWVTRRVQTKRLTPTGVEVVDKIVYEGPAIDTPRLEDVLVREEWEDCQTAPIVFLRQWMTWQDLQSLAAQGFFEHVDKIESAGVSGRQDRGRSEERKISGIDSVPADTPQPGHLYEVLKTYVRFDADKDGMAEDIIVWYQPDAKVILRAEWNELGLRPVRVSKYIAIPGQFHAVGVGWMLEHVQREIDTLHNMRINSIHVSSLQMFLTRRGSGVISNDEDFHPLKNIEVDDPSDFTVIKFPSAAADTFQSEEIARNYGRTVTGISEGQLGMSDTTAKSGTTPTLQQFLASQGNKILRSTVANAEKTYGEIALDCLLLLVANSDRVLASGDLLELATPADRELIKEVLRMDVEDIPLTFQFTVHATRPDETEDAKRQMILTKTQLYTQYFQVALQIQQMLTQAPQGSPLWEFVNQMFVGMTRLMEETFKLYDVDNPMDYLPAFELNEMMTKLLVAMRQPQIEAMKEKLKGLKGERQGNSEEMGNYTPGYTADEGPPGLPGVEGAPEMAIGPGGPGTPPVGGGTPTGGGA